MRRDASLVLRGLMPWDEPQWRRLWADYLAFYRVEIDPVTTDLTWRRMLDDAEPVRGIVACLGKQVIGLAHVVLHRSTWSNEPVAYLKDLFVASIHRRRGVARALIQAATICSASAGASRLSWLTKADNASARSLYDRVAEATGFVQYAIAVCEARH